VGKPWHKARGYTLDNVDRFENLDRYAQGIRGIVLQRKFVNESAGTIVEMRDGETAIAALCRHCRIVKATDVRMWRKHAPSLFTEGFFYIEGAAIKFTNYVALNEWRHARAPVPPPFYIQNFDPFDERYVFDALTGDMVHPATRPGKRRRARTSADTSAQGGSLHTDCTPTAHQQTQPPENTGGTPSSSSSDRGQECLKTVMVGGRPDPQGAAPQGEGSQAAPYEWVDERTGEVKRVDPAEFIDAPGGQA
jgi:hypothetical protein